MSHSVSTAHPRRRLAALVLALGVLGGASSAVLADGPAADGETLAKLIKIEETGASSLPE
jgi:hypothetical protein